MLTEAPTKAHPIYRLSPKTSSFQISGYQGWAMESPRSPNLFPSCRSWWKEAPLPFYRDCVFGICKVGKNALSGGKRQARAHTLTRKKLFFSIISIHWNSFPNQVGFQSLLGKTSGAVGKGAKQPNGAERAAGENTFPSEKPKSIESFRKEEEEKRVHG
ncbi:hypothetical protein NPIL_190781 [Nephila pilipes]|uniref:Uncharacterized protein n=1 Tax=Nephila pilipes TaxID=299642 RepID=A0A8X6R147_NEPPI|nr:hypothetical protein NPIL_190781 [Nephila pilipes]